MENQLSQKYLSLLICVALIILTFVSFQQVLRSDFVDYDDNIYVTQNPNIQQGLTRESLIWAFTEPHAKMWHPLASISHIIDYQLYALNPAGHHLSSLLFHIANTLLLFCVLKMLITSVWQSAFIAALFAIHPVNVESVAWIAERKNVISFFFWMLTIIAYLRYTKKTNITRYLLLIATYAICITTKPMVVTLPFVLLLLDYWPLERLQIKGQPKTSIPRLIAEKIPLFILSALLCIITYNAQDTGGVVADTEKFTFTIRASNAIVSYVTYLGKLIFPANLAALYPHPIESIPLLSAIICFIILAPLTIASLIMVRYRKHPFFTTGWLWYLGTLIPVIGLVQVGIQSMADRYMYIPAIGLFLIVTIAANKITKKSQYQKQILTVSAILIILTFAAATKNQVKHWKDTHALATHALDVTENNYIMHDLYGKVLHNTGQYPQALQQFTSALQINPKFNTSFGNLGLTYYESGQLDLAIEMLTKFLEIKQNAETYDCLGKAVARKNDFTLALKYHTLAVKIKPNNASYIYNWGVTLKNSGKIDQAIEKFKQTLKVNPNHAGAIRNLQTLTAAQKLNRK